MVSFPERLATSAGSQQLFAAEMGAWGGARIGRIGVCGERREGGSERRRRGLLEGPPQYQSRQPRSPLGNLRPTFPFGKGTAVIQVEPRWLSPASRTQWLLVYITD